MSATWRSFRLSLTWSVTIYARKERTIALTDRGRQVLELIRRQDALPADDEAGRAAIERQLGELLNVPTA